MVQNSLEMSQVCKDYENIYEYGWMIKRVNKIVPKF